MPPNFETDLLLITAATGKQATALFPHLTPKWKRLRLNVSSAASADRLKTRYPKAEITTHDLADPQACVHLFSGVSYAYAVTPGFHPKETQCGINMVDAALAQRRGGGPFKHFLLSSVIFPIKRKLLNHDSKRYIQEYLVESELPYTIIEPTHLMESFDLPGFIRASGNAMPRFWNPATHFSLVSTRDVGEACANIFADPERHLYATYQLVGTVSPMSYVDAASIISEELGREVKLEQKSLEESMEIFAGVLTHGRPEEAGFEMRQGIGKMFMYYNGKGLLGNRNVLEMLLGRKPWGYRDWVKVNVKEAEKSA